MTQLATDKTPSEDARLYQLLAALPGTVEDHLRDSLLATYLSLDEKSRLNYPDAAVCEAMLRRTQRHLFNEQLISQRICTQLATSGIEPQLQEWSINLVSDLPVNKVRFFISGDHLSGKTMLLSSTATSLYRRVQSSAERDNYLFFPWNLAP
jgi:hypothetical protein